LWGSVAGGGSLGRPTSLHCSFTWDDFETSLN